MGARQDTLLAELSFSCEPNLYKVDTSYSKWTYTISLHNNQLEININIFQIPTTAKTSFAWIMRIQALLQTKTLSRPSDCTDTHKEDCHNI